MQLVQILDKGYRDQKNPQLPFLKSQKQKQGVGSKTRVLNMPPPVLNTTKEVGKPLQPDPAHMPTLTPNKE